MALTAYMKVTGKSQGEIKGDCTQAGDKKDRILLYGMDHSVEIPKDTHTGLPTGQRIHKPFTVTKHKDKASPKLFQACCKGEQLTAEIDFYHISPSGEEQKYYTIKMEEAIIVDMRENTPLTFLTENKPYHDMEEVSFTYSKITWTYADGNIEFTDSWKGA
ncbi:Hcp family type VI secretion system effector [Halodesulfovibrio sp. MK-HDV]|jgi:type VI secretion system secreted protein Hcp|uniref:Hcp family type VI secretion system effector n=1 Tax=Halodesulfovibrio sp. MK-HDV TaxID=2599925 RepID=UPI00136DF841|nr:Hcp family type VI secretion system effector [Halodesulfovibrio sp. MK-HDV]KAF1077361.1 Major exported protein [Halodesulfovibrio sp. MK-HDV]